LATAAPELSTYEAIQEAVARPVSVKDQATIQHVMDLFYRARDAKRPLRNQWVRSYQVLHNQTWAAGRPPWMPSPEVAEIYPIIASIVGWMCDQRPVFEVGPAAQPFAGYYEFYSQLASDLKTTLDSIWSNEDYDAEVEKVLWDSQVYGTGFFKMMWDQGLVGGLGNPSLLRVDPFTIYPDPDARSDKDCNFWIEARLLSRQDIERRWPGALKKIGHEGHTFDVEQAPTATGDRSTSGPRANPGAVSPATQARWAPDSSGTPDSGMVANDPGITVLEAWLRTPVTVERDGHECTYDSWRVVVVAGNCVLMDEAAEDLWDHGQHPYKRFVMQEEGEFWGKSMVRLLTPCQLSINRLLAAIEHHIWLTGNPVFMEGSDAELSRQRVTNSPGQRLMKREGAEAGWLNPPPLAQGMEYWVQFYINEMERISGLSAIVRGGTPGGRNAEGVLQSVQESAFVRIRTGLRNLERSLRHVGQLGAALVAEFYDAPRMIAIVGPSGEKSSLALHGQHFYLPSPEGRTPLRFSLMVQAGSSLPTSRAARIQEIDTLFAMGVVDEQAVLEAHDIPHRQEILERWLPIKRAGEAQPPSARQRSQRTQ
jgi:hypothetical protein